MTESVDELDRQVGIIDVVDAADGLLGAPGGADLAAGIAGVEDAQQLTLGETPTNAGCALIASLTIRSVRSCTSCSVVLDGPVQPARVCSRLQASVLADE